MSLIFSSTHSIVPAGDSLACLESVTHVLYCAHVSMKSFKSGSMLWLILSHYFFSKMGSFPRRSKGTNYFVAKPTIASYSIVIMSS